MDSCQRVISGYKAITKPIPMLMPYGSKYFGMAFIPEGEFWPVCENCQREMVLVLQLHGKDLPETPDGFLAKGEMLQVFTCAYVDTQSSDEYWNKSTGKPIVHQTEQKYCFHGIGAPVSKHVERETQPARLDSDVLRKEYVQICKDDRIHTGSEYWVTENYFPPYFGDSFSPLHFFTRVINVEGQQPKNYKQLPWIEAYHFDLKDDILVDKFPENEAISQELLDWTYYFINDRQFFLSLLSKKAYQITNWEKLSYKCGKSLALHELFNGCFSFGDDVPACSNKQNENYRQLDYLGALTMDRFSFFDRDELGRYPNCDCCNEPMTLLFSFPTSDIFNNENDTYVSGWGSDYFTPLQGLFYCRNSGEFQVECIDERRG